MKTKSSLNMLQLFLIVNLFFLLSLTAFGVSYTQETSGQWTQAGFDRFNSQSYAYSNTIFKGNVANGTNFTYTDNEVAGGNFQPIAFDWDGDGTVEIIASSSTTFNIYDPSTNSLVLEYSAVQTGTMGNQGYCGIDDTLGRYCVFVIGTEIITLTYDGSGLTSVGSADIPSDLNLESSINCFSDGDHYVIPYCFLTAENTTSNYAHRIQYKANDFDDISVNTIFQTNYRSLQELGFKHVISDIDYDGALEIIYIVYDVDSDPQMIVYEWNNVTNAIATDSSFGTSGRIEITTSNVQDFGNVLVYDLDSSSDQEICILTKTLGGSYGVNINCYNADGTSYDSETLHSSATSEDRVINLLYADVDGDNIGEIVAVTSDDNNLEINVLESSSGSLTSKYTYNYGTYAEQSGIATATKMNDDDYFDIVYDGLVFYFNSSGEVESVDVKNIDEKFVVPVNFNKDSSMDYVGQELNSLSLYTNSLGGVPTSSTISLNTNLDDSGFYNYYSTVCKDTITTFKALECVSGSFDSTCTYINTDTEENERIYTTCGGLGEVNGTYDGLNPSVSCNFSQTGNYNVNLYVQDLATSSYYGVYDTISITVVDGTSGVDCNVASEFITNPSSQTDTSTPSTVDTAEDFFNIFSYGSSTMKFVFGLIIILGLCVMAYGTFRSVLMTVIFGIAGLILSTILGLIPLWVIVGMGLLMALPLLLKMAFGTNG